MATNTVRVVFDSEEWLASHGRSPKGRGSWAFEILSGDVPPVPRFYPSSTFVEARKTVIADIKKACAIFGVRGEVVLNVCP